MKKDVGAITPHAFGDHQHCDQRWCKYLEDPSTYRHKSLPFGKDLTDASLRTELYTVFEKYTTKAMCNKMSEMQSSNSNENLIQLIARKAPKALHYSGLESLDFRVSAAMAQKNDGHSYYPEVCKMFPFF